MYAIAPTVDRSMLELQSDFVTLQKALVDLKIGTLMQAKLRGCSLIHSNIYSLDGSLIERVPAYKYLGVWIDKHLTFKEKS